MFFSRNCGKSAMGLTASLLVIVVILVISTSICGLFQRCPMVLHIYQVATNLLAASLYSLLQTVSRFFSEIKHIITYMYAPSAPPPPPPHPRLLRHYTKRDWLDCV